MISEKLQKAINEQITAEMWSSNLYLAMSFFFEKEGFSGFAHWMKKQSQEEMGHAYAMADYIIKRGGKCDNSPPHLVCSIVGVNESAVCF